MKKLSKLGQALSIIALFVAMWLVYAVLVFSFEASENNNSSYIPDNASTVYRLDGKVLSRELLASLLISEDEDLRQLTQNKIPTTEKGKLKPVGISFDSDIILFRLDEGEVQLSGMLFNLWDKKVFNRNLPKYLGDNGAIASTEDVGLVLLQIEGNLTRDQLRKRAKKMLSKETSFAKKHPAPEENAIMSLWYQEGNTEVTDVGLSIQDNQLLFKGKFKTATDLSHNHLAQYKGGFHIHSKWFPKALNTEIHKVLEKVGIELPELKQFSLNYFGTTIVTEPSVAGLPYMCGTFEFEAPVEVDSLFKDFEVVSSDSANNKKTYDVYSMKYSVIQHNPTTIAIQSLEGVNLKDEKYASVAEISGSPKYLLKLDGDPLIRGIVVFTSEFKSISSFVNEIKDLNIKMTETSGDTYRIEGKIELNEDKWPLNELLKFLIRSNLF